MKLLDIDKFLSCRNENACVSIRFKYTYGQVTFEFNETGFLPEVLFKFRGQFSILRYYFDEVGISHSYRVWFEEKYNIISPVVISYVMNFSLSDK